MKKLRAVIVNPTVTSQMKTPDLADESTHVEETSMTKPLMTFHYSTSGKTPEIGPWRKLRRKKRHRH
ncbi:hypothetical protein VNO78_34346 [Psophocarpus tetragonolobus]|uniref:Uncharacterized protein n=1 Tax=Psophocarpus tetragonolobus TaxID=3891 RepID=A0AAN9NZ81_PSOTE